MVASARSGFRDGEQNLAGNMDDALAQGSRMHQAGGRPPGCDAELKQDQRGGEGNGR
jgi:hypothetical protein